ncbi:MAG TPA: PadR family transcriptional regulator [Nocardioidaceae bacterium]|nr:PadR family transcriptional regulator [Nocardioidaceae bacterium]
MGGGSYRDPWAGRHGPWSHQMWTGSPFGAGPPPWVTALFGGPGTHGHGGFKGPRVRRGDVRVAILDVLSGQPMNGYQVIQQIAERSAGGWKPSPGSVYPTLQQLEDEGLVRSTETEGRKTFELTESGRAYLAEHAEEVEQTWRPFTPDEDDVPDLKRTIGQVAAAVWQLAVSGSPDQQEAARDILAETRRKLYSLLAEGDEQ